MGQKARDRKKVLMEVIIPTWNQLTSKEKLISVIILYGIYTLISHLIIWISR